MAIQAASTKRLEASSAQSGTAVAIYTGSNSISVAGAVVSSSTQVSLGIVAQGVSSSASTVTVASGPSIANIQYLDTNNNVISNDIAVSTSGGNILITGTGFVANSNVFVNGSLVSNTFISSTQVRAVLPSASSGNVSLMMFTPTNVGTVGPTVRYSGSPTWTTAAVSFSNNTVANIALVASSDSTLTYTLQAGSVLPNGISLNSAGYLAGTPTGYSNNTTSTVVIIATDLEGQATQQTINWTVIAGDPQFNTTVFLMNADSGTNTAINANNVVFLDSSGSSIAITPSGKVTQGSVSPFAPSGYSNYFNGSTDYFTLPVSTNLAFSGDYTIECWVLLNTVSGTQGVYSSIDNSADTWQGPYLGFSGTSFLATSYISGPDTITHQTAVTAGQWYHIAIVRSGNITKSYLNGVQSTGTTTSTYSLTQSGGSIGTAYPGSGPLNGYISNLRVVKGTALYNGNFTPSTTPLTAVSGTQLLTCQSNRFIDNSSNSFAVTVAGTPSVIPFSPFAPATGSYTPSIHGGSIYCDGTTGYVSAASNANFNITSGSTDSFVCEFWVNFSTVAASTSIVDNGGVNGISFQNWSVELNASKYFTLVWGDSGAPGSQIGILPSTIIPLVNQWYHVALVKTNADWSLFINGTKAVTYSGLNTATKSSASPLQIGYGITTGAGGARFKGYISNLRIYKGATASAPYAATAASITVPTAPVTAITNTQLLLNGTNGALIDSTCKFVFDTTTATLPATSTTQSKFSNSINLTSKYMVNSTANPALILGTGDFTVECWIYWTSTNYNGGPLSLGGTITGQAIDIHSYNSTGYLYFAGLARSIGTLPVGTWNHYAIVRQSGVTKFYLDGVYNATVGAVADTNNYATTFLQIGYYQSNLASNTYVDDIRISRFARYTANFTPPSSAFLGQ